jgi:hypothetical protein
MECPRNRRKADDSCRSEEPPRNGAGVTGGLVERSSLEGCAISKADINLATEHPEFNAWRWVPLQDLGDVAVSFKRQLYVDVVGEFATIFRD